VAKTRQAGWLQKAQVPQFLHRPITELSGLLFSGTGNPVADYATAMMWYERLLGFRPTFFPHDTEAVFELAEHRYLYIVQQPAIAGHARHTLFVCDLDSLIAQIADRGIQPATRDTYPNGCGRLRTVILTERDRFQRRRAAEGCFWTSNRHRGSFEEPARMFRGADRSETWIPKPACCLSKAIEWRLPMALYLGPVPPWNAPLSLADRFWDGGNSPILYISDSQLHG